MIYKYWGKASREDNSYHLLPYHCLDVAAVGKVLLNRNTDYLRPLLKLTGLDEVQFITWFTFLLALHDIGKFADSFQNLNPDVLSKLQQRNSERGYIERHDTMGWLIWQKHLRQDFVNRGLIRVSGGRRHKTSPQAIDLWIAAMVGHHGQPPKQNTRHSISDYLDEKRDFAATSAFCDQAIPLLLGFNPSFPKCDMESMRVASWWLSGLAVLSDWLGSNTKYFRYFDEEMPLKDYWESAQKRAEEIVQDTELLSSSPSQSINLTDLIGVDPSISIKPTPLQQCAANKTIADSPHLFILEDVTGAGKTEAAMLLAHGLMRADQGSGLYYALPTMATANTMYGRMKDCYRKLFTAESSASLILAHGARDMSVPFRQSVLPEMSATSSDYGDGTAPAGAHCNAWLADNRKKALLADIGVGTVDQALLAVLPARHQSLRLLGLLNKILIVDEVHACDAYMHELLCALISAHAAAGGSAILLSATLPKKQRQALLDAYSQGQGWDRAAVKASDLKSYPLLSSLSYSGLEEDVVDTRDSVRRTVKVNFLSDRGAVDNLLADTVTNGNCACWIRNTVKDAIEAYDQIKKDHPDWAVDLFHARYAMTDRIDIENRVVERFDKRSTRHERRGQILIATQVVEQSLDLDFDTLITDLAPVDLVIQRAGRLNRHTRDMEGNPIAGDDQRGQVTLNVFGPEVHSNPNANWYSDFFPSAHKVYENHGQLWLTANLLYQKGLFKMPEDARMLIESVYGAKGQDDIPETLLNRSNESEGSNRADASLARLNALSIEAGFSDIATNSWWDEAKTPTRLGEETTTVYLAKCLDGKLIPWSDDKEHAWAMSAVSMRTWLIAEEKPTADISQQLIDQCKAAMPAKGKWGVLLPLVRQPDGIWRGLAMNEKKETAHFIYTEKLGLIVDPKNK